MLPDTSSPNQPLPSPLPCRRLRESFPPGPDKPSLALEQPDPASDKVKTARKEPARGPYQTVSAAIVSQEHVSPEAGPGPMSVDGRDVARARSNAPQERYSLSEKRVGVPATQQLRGEP